MNGTQASCPLTARQIADEYFIEHRTKLLDIAAFLDRLDRSSDRQDPTQDFRIRIFHKALNLLAATPKGSRLLELQMLLSDPTTDPRPALDQKSAKGAWDEAEVTA